MGRWPDGGQLSHKCIYTVMPGWVGSHFNASQEVGACLGVIIFLCAEKDSAFVGPRVCQCFLDHVEWLAMHCYLILEFEWNTIIILAQLINFFFSLPYPLILLLVVGVDY